MTNNEYLTLIKNTPFPIKQYEKGTLKTAYKKLVHTEPKIYSNIGLELVQHFHPSIWRCNRHGYPAPVDAWHDEALMLKVIQNRRRFLNTEDLSIWNLRSGLSIGKFAPKVSVFRPALAKYLIKKYLDDFNTIFDPCAGFSGRLLGTCCLNKNYIGQDINSITIKESNDLISFLCLPAKIIQKDSLYDMGVYDCLFTCPPYGNKESWHQEIEELSADEWIDTCLNNYKCNKYLFVVDVTDKYKNFIVETLQNNSHFSNNKEQVVLITAAPK